MRSHEIAVCKLLILLNIQGESDSDGCGPWAEGLTEVTLVRSPGAAPAIQSRLVSGRLTHLALRTMDGAAKLVLRPPKQPQHLQTGRRGEEEAYFYLRRMGYVIVARNYRSRRQPSEIDLVGWDGDPHHPRGQAGRGGRRSRKAARSAGDGPRIPAASPQQAKTRLPPRPSPPKPCGPGTPKQKRLRWGPGLAGDPGTARRQPGPSF